MPWRLISFIICLILITIFAGFNLDNKCDISFGFKTLPNVPIFLSLMVSFLIGIVVMLPFAFRKRNKDRSQQYAAHGVTVKTPAASAKKTGVQHSSAKQDTSKPDVLQSQTASSQSQPSAAVKKDSKSSGGQVNA